MIHYLDNGATTYPKPESVYEAACRAMKDCGGNPGRGVHPLALASLEAVYETREKIAALLGGSPERVVFTVNATEALNLAIKGLVKPGGHILISEIEHNSVRRPVEALRNQGCSYDLYSVRGTVDDVMASIRRLIRPETCLIVACHRSNVAPITLPIVRIGALCREKGIRFVVDAAQSAGSVPIDMEKMKIDALCAPGHKGLFGIMGSGFVLFGGNVPDASIATLLEGGSGLASYLPGMPEVLPERLEAGTLPVPAIAALGAGIEYVRKIGVEQIGKMESELLTATCDRLLSTGRVRLYGPTHAPGSALLFNVENRTPSEVSAYLSGRGICTRAGIHCTPLAHQLLGTPKGGAVRVSLSPMNTLRDADALRAAIREMPL
ncbi:MAG: aminotransferase class V-fold PLP-dependent enzyme [Eubacteriales bacterium]